MYYTCVIVDDEQHAIDLLNDYIEENEFLKVSGSYINPLVALEEISKREIVDFLFLDIDMPGMKGTELSTHLRNKAKYIIYAYSNLEHDIITDKKSYESYLGKPISPKKFSDALKALIFENSLPLSN